MVTVALTVAQLSFGVFYFGLCLVEGKPVKFGTVIIPGRYKGTAAAANKPTSGTPVASTSTAAGPPSPVKGAAAGGPLPTGSGYAKGFS